MEQGNLFDIDKGPKKDRIGLTAVNYKKASSILTPASGFMNTYDYTLNPYSGCGFGCSYCYAAFFTRDNSLKEQWGLWVNVKENALQLLQKWRKKPLVNKTIYISSVTDPYQPIERDLELTREILKELLEYHKPRIVIQTRSPLAKRDIDLFKRFEHIQVNMTITTDSESVRKIFEPLCPSNNLRLNTIKEISDSGISTCITMTPLLPIESVESFVEMLLASGVQKFIVQPFHTDRGKFAAGTREGALKLIKEMNWTDQKYLEVEEILRKHLPNLGIGKDGFAPI
jgi:DNA repair photolyase